MLYVDMRRFVIPLLIILITANFALSGDEKKEKDMSGWSKIETKHYLMYFQNGIDKKIIEFYKKYVEVLYPQFVKAFKYKETGKEDKFLFYMFANKDDYIKDGNPAEANGLYMKSGYKTEDGKLKIVEKKIVSFLPVSEEEKERLKRTIAHEMTHQFCDMVFPTFDEQPKWFVEGMAECIGSNSNYENGQLKINALNTPRAKDSLDAVRGYISKEQAKDKLKEVLDNPPADFTLNAFSFTFCHFLWNTKDPKVQSILPKLIDAYKKADTDLNKFFSDLVDKVDKEYLLSQWQSHVSQMQ